MRTALTVLLAAVVCGAGCSGEGQEAANTTPDSGQVVPPAATASGVAQDADHEFLRMMSDHHEGLVVMGEDAMNRATDDSVRSAAHMLHTKQAADQDTMIMMITRMYSQQHVPRMMPKNAAQADTLRSRQAAEVDRYFLQTTIAHHEEGIAMIDQFMPRLAKPEVRSMAEKMRDEQQREIRNLQGKLDSL